MRLNQGKRIHSRRSKSTVAFFGNRNLPWQSFEMPSIGFSSVPQEIGIFLIILTSKAGPYQIKIVNAK
jgi:hypothetical protein